METGLRGRAAFVSGASGAIGRAVALALAAEGAQLALGWHRDETGAAETAAAVRGEGATAVTVRFDQADPASVAAAVAQARAALGPVAVLVANAVRWPDRQAPELAGLRASLATNTVGTAALVDAVLGDMRAGGWGRIVLISTDVVAQPLPGPLAYGVAKGALETAARVLAVREAPAGVLTNVVRPGFTLTERVLETPGLGTAAVAEEAARTPTGRICTPEDVASVVTYLASAANGHVNGQTVSVAGGRELVR